MRRRAFLRGMGGAVIPLPFLEITGWPRVARAGAASSAGGRPTRFVMVFTGSGQGADWWKSTSAPGGTIADLGPVLAPFEKYKKDLILIDGLDNRTAMKDTTSIDTGHEKPMLHVTTCANVKNRLGGGISIDQAIAKEIGDATRFRSLQLGVHPGGPGPGAGILSYLGAGLPMQPAADPRAVFARVFGDFKTDPAVLERVRAQRKSLLDHVQSDYGAFVERLGQSDRARLQAHLDSVRELERQIGGWEVAAKSAACAEPDITVTGPGYAAAGSAHMKLVAMALACDLTRVASIVWWGAAAQAPMDMTGVPGLMHDISHRTGPTGDADRSAVSKWHAAYFAGFLDQLSALPEPGGGTVFDNTIFYWCSEHGTGSHNYDRMPVLVAGSGGGYFKTGRRLEYSDGPGHGELYTSFLNAMGIPATSFGIPSLCRGPLPGMVG